LPNRLVRGISIVAALLYIHATVLRATLCWRGDR
jgi:hypothetical protein